MSSFLATYDPGRVRITLDEQTVFGFSEGTMVTVEKNEAFFNNMVGAIGEVSRAYNNDNTGMITFSLQHVSPFVEIIENMKPRRGPGGGIAIPDPVRFSVLDPSSSDKVASALCWINEDASHEWGNEVTNREYQFFAVNVVTAPNAGRLSQNLAYAQFQGTL